MRSIFSACHAEPPKVLHIMIGGFKSCKSLSCKDRILNPRMVKLFKYSLVGKKFFLTFPHHEKNKNKKTRLRSRVGGYIGVKSLYYKDFKPSNHNVQHLGGL